jgi:hypothetical protein
MKIEPGECVKVECDGQEIGLMWTDWGWALVSPTEERKRNVEAHCFYEDVPETVFVTTRAVIENAPVMFENKVYLRIKEKWDNLP